VSISPDKQDIYITVNVTEGEKYTISDVKLAGELQVPESELKPLITVEKGDIFNRQKITESSKAIGDRLGNEGYAFANVNAIPEINKENHTAAFTFFVDPGKRVYVHRINLTGNTRTRDSVLRREMRQLESAWYAGDKINRSKERLNRLNYFDNVDIETPAVPGTNDQVDVNINVTEKSTGSIQFGAGLSSSEGVVVGVTINQPNFLGTGNQVSAQVNTGKVNTTYSLSYTDPYFTPDGISRGFDIYQRNVDTQSLNIANYSSRSYGAGVRFGLPLGEKEFFSVGLTGDLTKINLTDQSPKQYKDFCSNSSGCTSNSIPLVLAWTYDSRDSTLFPSKGVFQRLTTEVAVPGLDLEYYKLEYKHTWYQNLRKDFTLMLNGELGYADSYGSKAYPFFKNFYVGGVNSVRGFDDGAIGPRDIDPTTGVDFATGGTKRIVGNAEIFAPVPFIKNSSQFRLSAFVDGGDVYAKGQGISLGDLRYSAGVGISWYSPFGPLKLVFAKPLNKQTGDRTQTLQFQLGSQF
jgi:outer membrane protein insertion porin family